MAIYNAGMVIRLARVAQNMKQEELSSGICAVETLSRLENGKQRVRPEFLVQLAKRLGLSGSMLDILSNKNSFDMEWNRIASLYTSSIFRSNLDEAEIHLLSLKEHATNLYQRQYVAAEDTYIRFIKKEICAEEQELLLDQVIRMTVPDYDKYLDSIFPYTLRECRYLMRLGSNYNDKTPEENDRALSLYQTVLRSIDAGYMCGKDVEDLRFNVLNNLCYVYSDTERYPDAISQDRQLLRLALDVDRASSVGDALCEIQWNVKQMDKIEPDIERQLTATRLARETAYIAMATKYTHLLNSMFLKNSSAWAERQE